MYIHENVLPIFQVGSESDALESHSVPSEFDGVESLQVSFYFIHR